MRSLEISHSRTCSSRYCGPDQSSGGMRVRRNLGADVNHDREGLGAEVTATECGLLGDARGATVRAICVIDAGRGRGALQLV